MRLASRVLRVAGLAAPLSLTAAAALAGVGGPSAVSRLTSSSVAWSSFFGGSGTDRAVQVLVAADGCPIVVGLTSSPDLAECWGHPGAQDDVFVAKFSADGSGLLWCARIGGGSLDTAQDACLTVQGDIAVVGNTISSDFPTTPGALDRTPPYGGAGAFAFLLSGSGTALIWSTYLAFDGYEEATAVASDDSGNVCVAGRTSSTDFPTTPDAFYPVARPGTFVTTFSPDGRRLVCSTILQSTVAADLVCVGPHDLLLTGAAGPLFPATAGSFDETWNGEEDVGVCLLADKGRSRVWGTFVGGSRPDYGYRLVAGLKGEIFVLAATRSEDLPVNAASLDQTYNDGFQDLFAFCLSADGEDLLWSTYLGGSAQEAVYFTPSGAAALDGAGNPVFACQSMSIDYPVSPDALRPAFTDSWDGVITILGRRTGRLVYSTFYGGGGPDGITGLAPGPAGRWFLAGYTYAPTGTSTFPATPGAYDETYNGGIGDAYVTMLEPPAVLVQLAGLAARRLEDASVEVTWRVAVDDLGTRYELWRGESRDTRVGGCEGLGGREYRLVDFAPGEGAVAYWLAAGETWHGPVFAGPAEAQLALRLAARGNPSRAPVAFACVLPSGTPGRLRVFDLKGSEVRDLGEIAPGQSSLAWDGADRAGRRCAPGVYLVRLETPRDSRLLKLTMMR